MFVFNQSSLPNSSNITNLTNHFVHSRQQLINLLDYAIYVRNLGFFILVLHFLRRTSMILDYQEKGDNKVVQITG